MAAPKVKSPQASAEKWSRNASAATAEYQREAAAAGSDWENSTVAGAANYKAGVSAGDIERRFSGGVRRVGAAKYSRGVTTKGGRYSEGVSQGMGDYSSEVAPFLQAIAGVDLPARRPRGDVANRERSNRIQDALKALRLARFGAGR